MPSAAYLRLSQSIAPLPVPSFGDLQVLCLPLQLPKAWREELARRGLVTGRSQLHHHVEAPDGTRKFLLKLQVPDPVGMLQAPA